MRDSDVIDDVREEASWGWGGMGKVGKVGERGRGERRRGEWGETGEVRLRVEIREVSILNCRFMDC